MQNQDFTTTILVDKTPAEAFKAINNVRGWWSENIEGDTDKLNGVFDYSYKDIHRTKIRVTDLEPGKKVAWHVLDNYFNFINDDREWKDTKMIFEIKPEGGKTAVRFTHRGLTPADECFDVCNEAWTHFIRISLGKLIETGKGEPTPKESEGSWNQEMAKRRNLE